VELHQQSPVADLVPRAAFRPRGWLRAAPFLVALGFVVLQIMAMPAVRMTNDGYRYGRTALQILGESRSQAQHEALVAICADRGATLDRANAVNPVTSTRRDPAAVAAECVAEMPNGLTPNSPRYEAIFDARVGYPLLAAPFVAAVGVKAGLYAASVLCTAVGGLLAYALLRSAGATRRIATLGQVGYAVSPIAFWGAYPLAEGPTMAATMAALLGAWWLLRERRWQGIAVLLTSLAVLVPVRYSSMVTVAVVLAVAGVVALLVSRSSRHAGTYLLIGLSLAAVVAAGAVAHALNWPGVAESLQDTFTLHFTLPDVADPWARLLQLDVNYWSQWLQEQFRAPLLLLLVAAGVWGAFRSSAVLGMLVTAVAATGPLTVVAHPIAAESERLMQAVWIAPVIGLPLLLSRLLSRREHPTAQEALPPASPSMNSHVV
jgi:hypothetical protein